MAMNQATKKESSSDVKAKINELEEKIFKEISAHYRFKEIPFPFAVLDLSADKIVLASYGQVIDNISYSRATEAALKEIVSKVLGGVSVTIDFKTDKDAFLATQKRIERKIEKAKKEEILLAEVEEQKSKGRCNLIPFPVKENKVRSDLTVERHAVFAANTFKGDFRVHERKIRDLKTGIVSKLRVEIGDPTGRVSGVLKQKHQEAFYKLAQLWSKQSFKIKPDEKGRLKACIKLSVYDLVQLLRGEDAGKAYKKVFELIDEMATIRINIEKTNSEDDACEVKNFTLLSYDWEAKGFNKETLRPNAEGESAVYISFSQFVTDQFLRKNIKSLTLDPYFQLKDRGRKGVSQLLYTMLDYELSTKEKFNISLVNLSKRLGLTQYGFKSKRKQVVEGSVDAINNAPILDGKYKIDCHLTESEDEKDWVLIARRAKP